MVPFMIVALVFCGLLTVFDLIALAATEDETRGMAILNLVPLLLAIVAMSCSLGGC